MTTTRRQVTRACTLDAVRRAQERGNPQAQLAGALGSGPDMLRRWNRHAAGRAGRAAADVFAGNGQSPRQDDELRRLQRANERLRQLRIRLASC